MFITLASTKVMFFIAVAHVLSSLWNLKFPWTYMGKIRLGLYLCLITDTLTNVLQNSSLSCPLLNISFLSNPLNFIGCHGNRKAKFAQKI